MSFSVQYVCCYYYSKLKILQIIRVLYPQNHNNEYVIQIFCVFYLCFSLYSRLLFTRKTVIQDGLARTTPRECTCYQGAFGIDRSRFLLIVTPNNVVRIVIIIIILI